MKIKQLKKRLFNLSTKAEFEDLALEVFRFQYNQVELYRTFCQALKVSPDQVTCIQEIPFLPIQFFKSHQIIKKESTAELVFTSSGTTGSKTSKHFVPDPELYEHTFKAAFNQFYGNIKDYAVLALLPSYLERTGSSLIYMAQNFIEESEHPDSGFYLNELKALGKKLRQLDAEGQPVLLIGVSFALLDLIEQEQFSLEHTIVMETGGMKGRRKELTRQELHARLCLGFGIDKIHSEYGMTELLSQAYSKGEGLFYCPRSMDILIREPEDPLHILKNNKNGGINVIDLANLYSCSFIATQDLGKKRDDGSFEVLGRFDHSDIRGCNLMVL